MRAFLFSCVFFIVVLPLRSAETAKVNTLTPAEAADGWLLLFDGKTSFGWSGDGNVTIENGVFTLADDAFITPGIGVPSFDLQFESRVRAKKFHGPSLYLSLPGFSHQFTIDFLGRENAWTGHLITVQTAGKKTNWSHSLLDGKDYRKVLGSTEEGAGRGLLTFSTDKGSVLDLRNIKLKPRGLQSFFNGKNLSGWKEFPGQKSKFTVTPEGWLNIKDGKGDLQTEGQWADFVLQFDCISNGPHLNSGVFFRCRPGEYQQGYEAQIRNEFTPQPTQEYLLEEYDPLTHQLKEKKKVAYTAVDFGTGAIYRRQPARVEVAKDREWFTMTVMAHGRHMATWVNGIQVTDWTDNRPLKDNARQGAYLKKGPISLQGHDPTTDLSFRNFRIAELPAEK